jgi:serine protease Do
MTGEVIGVNTAIFTQSAGYQGIGFAMPSNTVVSVYNDLVSPSHKVVRGSIGIQFRPNLSGAINRVYGFKTGVLVQQVQPGGPADKAGLKPGDIITQVDGRPIKDGDDLVNEIASRKPGSSIRLGFLRDGKPTDTTVTVGDRDKVFAEVAAQQGNATPDEQGDLGETKLGIVVREAPPAVAGRLHAQGMVVQSVRAGSFADLSGLEPGLLIVRINKQSTSTKAQYDAVVSKLKTGDDVAFEVMDPRRPNDGINYLGGTMQ